MLSLNEKRFASIYLQALQNSEDGSISCDIWTDYLSPKRESLGLTLRDSTKVTNLVDKYGTDNLHPIVQVYEENGCKGSLFDYDVKLTIKKNSDGDAGYQELIDNIHEYEVYAQQLLDDTKQFEKKTQQLSKEVYDIINPVAKTVSNTLRKSNPNAFMIAGGILALAAIGNWLYEKHQKNKLLENYQRKMRQLQEQKSQEAQLKLPELKKRRQSIRKIFIDKVDKNLQKDFDTCISDKKELSTKYYFFKRTFSTKMNLEYLDSKLAYIQDEYEAWIDGQTSACNPFPIMAEVVDREILNWFQTKLDRKVISDISDGQTKELTLPYVLLISEPYLLRRHIGFYSTIHNTRPIDEYFNIENYARPLLDLSKIEKIKISENLFIDIIKKNDYFKEIDHLDHVCDNVKEKGVCFWDILIAFILYIVMLVLTSYTFFIVPILILCFWRKKLSKIFPIYYREKWYYEEIDRLQKDSLQALYSTSTYNTI